MNEDGAEDKLIIVSNWLTEGWPETTKALLANRAQWDQESEPGSEDDFELLSLIVDEAAQGVDIARRFPAFRARMMGNADLREAFLETLELLVDSRAGRLRPLPVTAADFTDS
jgi:hypothetical protein